MTEYIERQAALDALQAPEMFGVTPRHLELIKSLPAADVVPGALFHELRDELCLYCGKYTEQHLGACDGCKWRADNE